jgi:integrative and conjugative element protein (TIGR02256 family)
MSLIWRKSGTAQRIRITDAVLNHVAKYQQHALSATEAGGQLFGTVSATEVRVVAAVGPHRRDERSRYRYRSDPQSAQRAISEQAKNGLLYLGEWHTHAEDLPSPSGDDRDAMTALTEKSSLCIDAALLLIVGRESPPAGVYLGAFRESDFEDWRCGRGNSVRRARPRNWFARVFRR